MPKAKAERHEADHVRAAAARLQESLVELEAVERQRAQVLEAILRAGGTLEGELRLAGLDGKHAELPTRLYPLNDATAVAWGAALDEWWTHQSSETPRRPSLWERFGDVRFSPPPPAPAPAPAPPPPLMLSGEPLPGYVVHREVRLAGLRLRTGDAVPRELPDIVGSRRWKQLVDAGTVSQTSPLLGAASR